MENYQTDSHQQGGSGITLYTASTIWERPSEFTSLSTKWSKAPANCLSILKCTQHIRFLVKTGTLDELWWDSGIQYLQASILQLSLRRGILWTSDHSVLGVRCIIHAREAYLGSKYKRSFSYSEAQEKNTEAVLVFLKYCPEWLIIFDHSSWNLHREVGCTSLPS